MERLFAMINEMLRMEVKHHLILADQLRASYTEIDDETLKDTLEGISNLPEAVSAVIRSSLDDEAYIVGLKGRLEEILEEAWHVREDLGDDVDMVLDGGPCGVGIESTILDLSRGAPVLLRPGGISAAELEAVLGEPVGTPDAEAPRVSGSLAAHYAPRTPARLVASGALDAEIARFGTKAAVLAFSAPDERVDFWLRMPEDPAAYAQKLYAALRELDTSGAALLLIETPPATPEWQAVLDRLRRAARD